jgi:L-threonylcarbamoyladenylate synthase
MFAVKGRDHAQVMHVACASISMIETVGVLTSTAARLLGEFTPGPLSVIVAKTALLPDRLVTMNGTVGIRVPDNSATLQIVAEVGVPLTATSLNPSGEPYVSLDEAGLGQLTWPEGEVVPIVEDPDSKRYDAASALVRVTGPEPEILRAGPIDEAQILMALGATPR